MTSFAILDRTICDPETKQPLERRGDAYYRSNGKSFRIIDSIASLVYPESPGGDDEKLNRYYDKFAPFYDLVQRILGRIILGEDVAEAHKKVIAQIPIEPGSRLLEVSPGPGTFHRFLRARLGREGLLVSLDLSFQMLVQCKKRGDAEALLVHANGQYLPFLDESFDSLFHFGGVNLFNDPDKALTEFIRVVRRGGIVSWGDEGFSANYKEGFKKKILTRMNPGYLKPRPTIPEGLCDVTANEVYGGTGYLVIGRKK